jgi:hypothetical protein
LTAKTEITWRVKEMDEQHVWRASHRIQHAAWAMRISGTLSNRDAQNMLDNILNTRTHNRVDSNHPNRELNIASLTIPYLPSMWSRKNRTGYLGMLSCAESAAHKAIQQRQSVLIAAGMLDATCDLTISIQSYTLKGSAAVIANGQSRNVYSWHPDNQRERLSLVDAALRRGLDWLEIEMDESTPMHSEFVVLNPSAVTVQSKSVTATCVFTAHNATMVIHES